MIVRTLQKRCYPSESGPTQVVQQDRLLSPERHARGWQHRNRSRARLSEMRWAHIITRNFVRCAAAVSPFATPFPDTLSSSFVLLPPSLSFSLSPPRPSSPLSLPRSSSRSCNVRVWAWCVYSMQCNVCVCVCVHVVCIVCTVCMCVCVRVRACFEHTYILSSARARSLSRSLSLSLSLSPPLSPSLSLSLFVGRVSIYLILHVSGSRDAACFVSCVS